MASPRQDGTASQLLTYRSMTQGPSAATTTSAFPTCTSGSTLHKDLTNGSIHGGMRTSQSLSPQSATTSRTQVPSLLASTAKEHLLLVWRTWWALCGSTPPSLTTYTRDPCCCVEVQTMAL